MIKIKLQEARTLAVPQQLVESGNKIYRAALLGIIINFIRNRLSSDKVSGSIAEKYNTLLEEVQSRYSSEYALAESMGFTQIDYRDAIAGGVVVKELPVKQLIQATVEWEGLQQYLGGKVEPKDFKKRLNKHFKEKGLDNIQFNIEFKKTPQSKEDEDYSALYQSDIGAVTVAYKLSLFQPTSAQDNEGNPVKSPPALAAGSFSTERILTSIGDELDNTRIAVRHELQHLFQNILSSGLGVSGRGDSWRVGLPPRQVVKRSGDIKFDKIPHHMIPVEMQTDVQDEADKLSEYINKFKADNSSTPAIFPAAIKIMTKIFADSSLSSEEKAFAKQHKLSSYIATPSSMLKNIKDSTNSGDLYKYALRTLFTSVEDQLRENIKMKNSNNSGTDNIKIILRENRGVLSEELTKREIRDIIRDELEKLLRNKEIRKEIGEITKKFIKNFYRELSINSTYVVDRIDV